MKSKSNIYQVLLCLGLLFLMGCKKEEKEQEMIRAALELKTELYRKEALAKCEEELMLKADVMADSILLTRVNVRNPIERPSRPDRPETPEVNFQDTLELIKPGKKYGRKIDKDSTF